VLAHEAHETRSGHERRALQARVVLDEERDLLQSPRPDRLNEAAAIDQLFGQGRGHVRERGGDNNRVERCRPRQARRAVAHDDVRVGGARTPQARARRRGEIRVALDAPHLARESREQRGLKSVAGADLEHPLGSAERERRDHLGDQRGLRRHLRARDRQRHVVVGADALIIRHELVARHCAKRVQHALVADAGRDHGSQEVSASGHVVLRLLHRHGSLHPRLAVRGDRAIASPFLSSLLPGSGGSQLLSSRSRSSLRHTLRSASVGESRAARNAGNSPAIAPIAIAAPMPPPQAEAGMTTSQSLAAA